MNLLSRLFSSSWKPHVITESAGASGSTSVVLRGLDCERNEQNGKIRFRGDFGSFLVDWLSKRWKEEGNSAARMVAGSPWRWKVEIPNFPVLDLEVRYAAPSSADQMISDTLDAIIAAIEKKNA